MRPAIRQLDWPNIAKIPLASANVEGVPLLNLLSTDGYETPLDIGDRARNDQIVDQIGKKTVDTEVQIIVPQGTKAVVSQRD